MVSTGAWRTALGTHGAGRAGAAVASSLSRSAFGRHRGGCVQVRKHAGKALDVLMETAPERAAAIQELKFATFNAEWLAVVEASDNGTASGPPSPAPASSGDAEAMLNFASFLSPKALLEEREGRRESGEAADVLRLDGDLGDIELPVDECDDEYV